MESTFNINNPAPGNQPTTEITFHMNSIQMKKKAQAAFKWHWCCVSLLPASLQAPFTDCMKGTLRINCKRFPSCLVRFQKALRGLPTHFTRQHYQPCVIAERKLHKKCTHLFLTKAAQNCFTSQNAGVGKTEKKKKKPSLVLSKEMLENTDLFKPTSIRGLRA